MKGILPRRASPSSFLLENSTLRNFQTDSKGILTGGVDRDIHAFPRLLLPTGNITKVTLSRFQL
jgi:hypothetical protein